MFKFGKVVVNELLTIKVIDYNSHVTMAIIIKGISCIQVKINYKSIMVKLVKRL